MSDRSIPLYAPAFVLERIEADPDFPRGYYARDVLRGYARLSGSDLRGKARSYGGWYARQRNRVASVAQRYGLVPVYDSTERGRRVWSWAMPARFYASAT